MRREISSSWLSLTAAGAVRSALSIVITTSAWLRAGRLPEPAKITASMSAARSDLCEVSPIAQRNASTRFDLPQPFGPTTPVRPGSITKSVGSTNDLKPCRRRRVSFIRDSRLAGRESPCRDNTIEGNVGVEHESLQASRMGATMAMPGREGNQPHALFPRLLRGLRDRTNRATQHESPVSCKEKKGGKAGFPRRPPTDQLFSSGLIFFSNSSIEVSPLTFSPLMKKVGVESTLSTSLAYFWSAAILSSSD